MRREVNETRKRSEQDAWMRWTGQQGGPDSRSPAQPRSDAIKAARYLLGTADLLTRDSDFAANKIELLFQDDREETAPVRDDPWLAAGGAWYLVPEVGDRLPLAAALVRPPPPPPPRWLTIDWFKRSPYFPIQIEAIEDLPGPRERWRVAFEDLMLASLDRWICPDPMPNDHSFQIPGIDWVFSLQTRSILPPLLPSLYCSKAPGKVQTNMIGYPRQLDYQEFSNLVDEIWKSNRSSLNDYWLSQLRGLSKYLPCKRNSLQWPDGVEDEYMPKEPFYFGTSSLTTPAISAKDTKTILGAAEILGEDHRLKSPSAARSISKTSQTTRMADGRFFTRTVVRHLYEGGMEENCDTVYEGQQAQERSETCP